MVVYEVNLEFDVAIAVPSAAILLVVGWVLFHRLEPSFVDEL